jgi:hypothetical protein
MLWSRARFPLSRVIGTLPESQGERNVQQPSRRGLSQGVKTRLSLG